MPLMILWLRLNDAGWFLFGWNLSTARFKTGGSCQTLKSLMLTQSLSGYAPVGFLTINPLPCPVSSHQHGLHLHLHSGWGVNVLQESWMFSTNCEAETCRQAPPAASWASVFSCALYLHEEHWVSCLHAAPTVTSLHVERAAVSRDFSL